MPLLGAHVSIEGGVHNALERGMAIGCEAIQIFTKNQMQWQAKPLADAEVQRYQEALKGIKPHFPVLAHDSYLINLGSPEKEKLVKSRQAFLDEMDRAEALSIDYLVFHPGAHLNVISVETCLTTIAESLNQVMQERPTYGVKILIENTAGQGSNVGYQFEHIAAILGQVEHPERLGVCFDTCHALAAGYDIRTEEGYQGVMALFDSLIGLDWLKAFHLNDSKKPLGSRVDRHEDIGEGCVGLETFRLLVNDKRFVNTPMILETPGNKLDYPQSLVFLRKLIKQSSFS